MVSHEERGNFVLPQPTRQTGPFVKFHPLARTNTNVGSSNLSVIQLGQLCTICASIRGWIAEHTDEIRTSGYQGPDRPHHASAGQLEQSFRDGCHLCTLLWSSLLSGAELAVPIMTSAAEREEAVDNNLSDLRNGGAVSIRIDRETPYGDFNMYLMPRVEVPEDSRTLRAGKTLDGQATDIYTLDQRGRSALASLDTTIGTAAFQWAKECFETCMASHTDCQLRRSTALPTRLLHITKLPRPMEYSQLELRLIDTETLPVDQRVQYAALSYCWGPGPSFKLEKHNEQLLRSRITEQQLPRTIHDAVRVAAELGIDFLWVDSLCIFQDSPEDWEREASRMCDVYQGSMVTLYAIGAEKNADGLFSHRDPLMYAACPLLSLESDEQTLSVMPRNANGNSWPLFERGWVVQERLLSLRQLRFGPYLEWECAEGRKSEFDVDSGSLEVRRFNEALSVKTSAANTEEQWRKLRLMWKAIVDHYSQAKLTVQTDRLAAISGAITAIQRGTGHDNIAGLWDPLRAIDLLWETTVTDRLTLPTQPSGLGPSWSWISVDGAINMSTNVSILDDLVTEMVATVNLIPSTPGQFQQAIQISCLAIRSFTVRETNEKEENKGPSLDLYLSDCSIRHLFVRLDDWTSVTSPVVLLVLMIKQSRVHGLALIPSKELPGAYSRIGVVREDPILFPNCGCSRTLLARTRKPELREAFILV